MAEVSTLTVRLPMERIAKAEETNSDMKMLGSASRHLDATHKT